MAEEIVTFGDFDEAFYQSYFGEESVSTKSLGRVEFPWDNQGNLEAPAKSTDLPNSNVTATQVSVGHTSVATEDYLSNNVPVPSSDIHSSNTNQPQATVSSVPNKDIPSAITTSGPFLHENSQYDVSIDPSLPPFDGSQKSNSLKRRNKKQRDPKYYDNFYNNPDLFQAKLGDNRRNAANRQEGTQSGAHIPDGAGDGSSGRSGTLSSVEIPKQAAETAVRNPADSQPDSQHNIGNNNLENVQLDDRTTEPKSCPDIQIPNQRTANLSNSTFSTSSNFPVSRVPLTESEQPKLTTTAAASHPTEPVTPSSVVAGRVEESPDQPPLNVASCENGRPQNVTAEVSQSAAPGHLASSDAKPEQGHEQTSDVEGTTASGVRSASGQAQQATAAPKPSPWGSKPTSWASLFRKDGESSAVAHSVPENRSASESETVEKGETKPEETDPVSADKDPQVKKLGEFLKNSTLINKPMFIQPRGLINVANNCYINSILQVLVACPPFYNLFQRLPLALKRRGPTSTPMLNAILELCKQFEELPFVGKKGSRDVRPGESFEPVGVYQMLRKVNTTLSIKQGKQEDAEEFLSCLLNGFHDEMIAAIEAAYGSSKPEANGPQPPTPNGVASDHKGEAEDEEDGDDDEWEQVGPKKKATITRVAEFTKSPIYNIFGGQMRSALHQHGARESATLQPFFTLQLDIQSPKITSVKEALENFGTKEAVHGFMSNKTKTEVEASKRTTLEELPPVLILHLKQFVYDKTGGCQKLTKKMDYEMDLEIGKDLLSPSGKAKIPPIQRTFKLFAVIYHTGKEASGGHYISDYYHVGINGWIRADDDLIKVVKPAQVMNPPSGFTPYLLVYRRREVAATSSHSGGNS